MATLGRAIDGSISDIPCPSCSRQTLMLRYVVSLDSRIGYLVFWCDSCLRGLKVSRVEAPDGVAVRSLEDPSALEGLPSIAYVE